MELYKKHRPSDFDSFVGNKATVNSLKSVMERKEPPHAILITGPSGTGKTTLGRIIKSKLGCSDYDYKEMDSAEYGGVDSIRDIRKQMRLSPMKGDVRVWLLDECHMLGRGGNSSKNEAQNALLKALEDTPPHVFFILATTDPQMLLKTIRNRCTTFTVEPLGEKELVQHMRRVCRKEKKKVPMDVLKQIYQDSLGSSRSALVILDKIIDLPEDQMIAAAEQQAAAENETIELCRALMDSSWSKVSKIIKGLDQDPESVRLAVLGYFNTVLLSSNTKATKEKAAIASSILDCFLDPFYASGRTGLSQACYIAVQD